MGNDGKKTLTPRRRFPGFREPWTVEPMEKLYSFMRNNALSRDKLNYESGTVKNIHYGDIHTKFSTLFDITKEVVPYVNETEEVPPPDSDDYCIEGDLIFADASEDTNDVGKSIEIVRLNGERLLSGQHTILARRNDDKLIVGFGGHLFRSGQIRAQIQKEAQGTKVYAISATRLANIKIVYPADKDEQQKIADCLTSLDELIAAKGRKVEALRAHKKGLMQQLFPREGETLPRLRFPEFRDAEEWKTRTMDEISVIVRGGSPRPIDAFLTNEPDGLNWLKIGDVEEGAKYVTRTEQKVRPEALSKTRVIRSGDFILSNSMSFGRPYISKIDTCIHDGWIAVTEIESDVNHEFLYYAIMAERSQAYFANQAAGGGVRNLTTDIVKALPLACCDPAEQQRIADCLSSLDARLTAESRKLDALKVHKRGLMQQLFPSVAGES